MLTKVYAWQTTLSTKVYAWQTTLSTKIYAWQTTLSRKASFMKELVKQNICLPVKVAFPWRQIANLLFFLSKARDLFVSRELRLTRESKIWSVLNCHVHNIVFLFGIEYSSLEKRFKTLFHHRFYCEQKLSRYKTNIHTFVRSPFLTEVDKRKKTTTREQLLNICTEWCAQFRTLAHFTLVRSSCYVKLHFHLLRSSSLNYMWQL